MAENVYEDVWHTRNKFDTNDVSDTSPTTHTMQLALTITEDATLTSAVLQRFIKGARAEGKTPEQKLAELITHASPIAARRISKTRKTKTAKV